MIFKIARHQSGLMEYEGREYLSRIKEIEADTLEEAFAKYGEPKIDWGFGLVDVAAMGDGWIDMSQWKDCGDGWVRKERR